MNEYTSQFDTRRIFEALFSFVSLGMSDTPKTKPLTLQELAEVLALGIIEDKSDEEYLRFALWWQFNNRIRRIQYWSKVTQEKKLLTLLRNENEKKLWQENLTALFDLLDTSDKNDRLIQAEIYREQGEFVQAMKILDELNDTDFQTKVEQLKQQANTFSEQEEFDRAEEIWDEIDTYTNIQEGIQSIRPHCQESDPFVIVVDGPVPSIYKDILCWGCCVIYLVVEGWTENLGQKMVLNKVKLFLFFSVD